MLEESCVAVFDDDDDVEEEFVGAVALDVVLDDVEEEFVEADALDDVVTVSLDEEACGAEGVAGGVGVSV